MILLFQRELDVADILLILVECTICNAADPGNYIVEITSSNDYQVHATSGSINIPVKQNGSTGTLPVISLSSTSTTTISGGDNASININV